MDDNDHSRITKYFEQPADWFVIEVKINDVDVSGGDLIFEPPQLKSIRKYLVDVEKRTIVASSAGLHINGEKKIPHIHYHFITTLEGSATSQPSRKRDAWLTKNPSENLSNCSFHYNKHIAKPVWCVLSYPLKEGFLVRDMLCYTFDFKPMTETMLSFLLQTGNSIYSKQCAIRERADASVERQKLALISLFDKCEQLYMEHMNNHSGRPPTFRELVLELDDYIATLELTEKPDPRNYEKHVKIACNKLGLWKYSSMFNI